jgi:biofilm PGA synthesis N-glycosyltransferase PgaC
MEDALIAVIVFWSALAFLLYTYLGYPIVLWLRSCLRTRPVMKDKSYGPKISILIVAHNEEKVIGRKLENTLNLNYQGERPEVLVASDGSTDRTNEIVREFKDKGVSLLAFPNRRGKAQALNEAIPRCRGEIIILSDARQTYASEAISELVANFRDPKIGGVTGDLQFQASPNSRGGEQIGLYWRYEKWIRRLQSDTDSIPVVTGAIHAIRKSLFRPLPAGVIADDLAIPMSIIMQGYRVVYDPTAKAYDAFPLTLKEEFRKRVRTIAGSYQYLGLVPRVLSPWSNRICLDVVFHKAFRILAPFALVALFTANLSMTAWPYRVILFLQGAFYLSALVGALLARRGEVPKALSVPYTFLMLNAVACVAFYKLATGAQTYLWEKE